MSSERRLESRASYNNTPDALYVYAYEPRWATAVGSLPFSRFWGMKTRTAGGIVRCFFRLTTAAAAAHVCIFLAAITTYRAQPATPHQTKAPGVL